MSLRFNCLLILIAVQLVTFSKSIAQESSHHTISPLGIAWGFDYGNTGYPPIFMNHLHELGVNSTKIYLFWNQIEPEKGHFDWKVMDGFLGQVTEADEVLVAVYSSSLWGTSVPTTLLPPSPAKSLEDYYDFIYALVKRAEGKVTYWQNDCEPNNPVYWAGTKAEYVEQTKVFYRAVKDADPNAIVVLGGYDGLFNPPGMPEMPNQRHGLSFFEDVLEETRGYYDVFDLRLYANPYTIPERVAYFQEKLGDTPIICTEYNGPGFMEFPVNRQYGALIAQWSSAFTNLDTASYFQVQEKIKGFYENQENLAPETKIFLSGISAEKDSLYETLQAADLIIRNVLALSSGIEKTFYWDFWHDTANKYDLMTVMYGKNKMADYENGEFKNFRPLSSVMKRFSELLIGMKTVKKIKISENAGIHSFFVEKGNGENFLIAWEVRNSGLSEKLIPELQSVNVPMKISQIKNPFGNSIGFEQTENKLTFPISSVPIIIFLK